MHSPSIGVFDSGVGGLTVAKEIFKRLPNESIIYLGDTARLPYGEKSRETIIQYSVENVTHLLQYQVKAIVIACNTATSCALATLKQRFQLPIIDVITAGAHKAAQVTKNKRIAILATRATVRSEAYPAQIQRYLPDATIIPIACPLLVPLVEERMLDHLATRLIIRDYLAPIKKENVDTILLGCTHYPLLRTLIQEEVSPAITLVDSATTCAEWLDHILSQFQLHSRTSAPPSHRFLVSDDPEKFSLLAESFLGTKIQATLIGKVPSLN